MSLIDPSATARKKIRPLNCSGLSLGRVNDPPPVKDHFPNFS